MTKKSIQKIFFSSVQNPQRNAAVHKKRMPIARCICGSEILVVPDLKAMNRAVNNHVAEHKKEYDSSEKIREFLTKQVLILASKINLSI